MTSCCVFQRAPAEIFASHKPFGDVPFFPFSTDRGRSPPSLGGRRSCLLAWGLEPESSASGRLAYARVSDRCPASLVWAVFVLHPFPCRFSPASSMRGLTACVSGRVSFFQYISHIPFVVVVERPIFAARARAAAPFSCLIFDLQVAFAPARRAFSRMKAYERGPTRSPEGIPRLPFKCPGRLLFAFRDPTFAVAVPPAPP